MTLPESLFSMPPAPLAGVACAFALAGLVKGVVGLGLPTVSMGLLALMMAPAEAAALVIVPSLVTNVWQIGAGPALRPLLARLAPMQVGVFAGTLAGAWAFGAPAGAWAMVCLGVVLVAYAGWRLAGARGRVDPRAEPWLGPAVGAATGLVTAATGVFVVPAVPYLQALGLGRDELVRAMGVSFTASTVALAAGLHLNASYPGAAALASGWMLVPALAGMYAGQALRGRLSPARFRLCFMGSLVLLGLHMILRELW